MFPSEYAGRLWPARLGHRRRSACRALRSRAHDGRLYSPFCAAGGHGRWFPRSSVPNTWRLRTWEPPGIRHSRAVPMPADMHSTPPPRSRAAAAHRVLVMTRPRQRRGSARPVVSRTSRQASRRDRPVGPFVVLGPCGPCPAPPVSTQERDATALPRHRPACGGLLLRPHSPSAAFETPECHHPGTGDHPAAAEDPALAAFVVRPVTSVAGQARRADRRTSGAPAPAQSPCPCGHAFEGQKPEAPLYPSTAGLPGLASSQVELTGKPFASA